MNNYAHKGGANLYGQSACFGKQMHILNNSVNNNSSISSDPLRINVHITKHSIYPGERTAFAHVTLTGLFGGLTTGIVLTKVKTGHAYIGDNKVQEIGIAGGTIENKVFKTSTSNMERGFKVSFKTYGVREKICKMTFLDCPFGFLLTNTDDNYFECQILTIPVIINYSLESQTITKRNFSWLGKFKMDNQSHIAANDYCPLDYCNPTVHIIKSHPDHLDQDKQC